MRNIYSVTPATLTYVATPQTAIAGTPLLPFTGTVTGFVLGQGLSDATTGVLQFTPSTTDNNQVGAFSVTGGGLAANNGNYVFVQDPGNSEALVITSPMPVINQPPTRPTIPSATGANDIGGSPFLPAGPGNNGNSGVTPPDTSGNPSPGGNPSSTAGKSPAGNTSTPGDNSTPGGQPAGNPVANGSPVSFGGGAAPADVATTLTSATSPAVEGSLSASMNGSDNSTPGGQPAGNPVANGSPVSFGGGAAPADVATTLTSATSPAVEGSLSASMNGSDNSTPGGQPAGNPVANGSPVSFGGGAAPADVATTLTSATSPAVEGSLSASMNGSDNSTPGGQPAGNPVANGSPVSFGGGAAPADLATTLTSATSPAVESSLSASMNGSNNSTPGGQPAGNPVANGSPASFGGGPVPNDVSQQLNSAVSPAVESSLSHASHN